FLCIDRSVFTDNNKLNIELLIKNLKNIIMKKLSILYITKSFISLSIFSVSFFTTLFQSFTSISVSDSLTLTISVLTILTFTTSDFIISAFIISSLYFKKILYRLNKLYFSVYTLLLFLLTLRIIYSLEIILIKDNNTVKTIFSHSQASSITFSFFSAEKIVYTLNYKYSAL
ncbi:hypothetical protein BDFG_09297, partial [Blastomyces dermatitidis ATCC 26199]